MTTQRRQSEDPENIEKKNNPSYMNANIKFYIQLDCRQEI